MGDYRVYKMDESGKTTGPPYVVWCEDDEAALILARLLACDQTREIWDGARRVATISATKSAPVLHGGKLRAKVASKRHIAGHQ